MKSGNKGLKDRQMLKIKISSPSRRGSHPNKGMTALLHGFRDFWSEQMTSSMNRKEMDASGAENTESAFWPGRFNILHFHAYRNGAFVREARTSFWHWRCWHQPLPSRSAPSARPRVRQLMPQKQVHFSCRAWGLGQEMGNRSQQEIDLAVRLWRRYAYQRLSGRSPFH